MNESKNTTQKSSDYQSPRTQSSNEVYLRIKSNPSKSIGSDYSFLNPNTLLVKKAKNSVKKFTFARIFDRNSSQCDLFDHSIRKRVVDFLQGESATIMTYGASNSGKTYTLYGSPYEPGIVPRAIEFLFSMVNCTLEPWYKVIDDNRIVALSEHERGLEKQDKCGILNPKGSGRSENLDARLSLDNSIPSITGSEDRDVYAEEDMCAVWISVTEIYNDNVYDLLADSEQPLKLFSRKDGSAYGIGLKFVYVTTALEACQLLFYARNRMTVAPTLANHESSRSHTFFVIKLLRYQKENAPDTVQLSTLTFCDTAGPTRFRSSQKEVGVRLTESKSINNSLLVFGRCMKAVCEGYSCGEQVTGPFRESKLTRILQAPLLGQQTISFVVTIDVRAQFLAETLGVLNVSMMARRLGLEVRRNTLSPIQSPGKSMCSEDDEDSVKRKDDLRTGSAIAFKRDGRNEAKPVTVGVSKTSADRAQSQWPNSKLQEYLGLETMRILVSKQNEEQGKRLIGKTSEPLRLEDVPIPEREKSSEESSMLENYLDASKYDRMRREFEFEQGSANRHCSTICDDLNKSICEVRYKETFEDENVDDVLCDLKREKSNSSGVSDAERSIYGDFDTETSFLASAPINSTEIAKSSRCENESLVTDKGKHAVESLCLKEDDGESIAATTEDSKYIAWLFSKLKCIFDEKTKTIETLRKDYSELATKLATRELVESEHPVKGSKEHLRSLKKEDICDYGHYFDEFFCNKPIDTNDLITRARVDFTPESKDLSNYPDSLFETYENIDPNPFVSSDSDIKEDSGIDSSYRSRRSVSVNVSLPVPDTVDKCTETSVNIGVDEPAGVDTPETSPSQMDDVDGIILLLQKMIDLRELKFEEYKCKLSCSERKLEHLLTKNEALNDLTSKLLIQDENPNECDYLGKALGTQADAIDKLEAELRDKCAEAKEASRKLAKVENDLSRVQQLQENIDRLDAFLKQCQQQKNDCQQQINGFLQKQSMLEMRLNTLSRKSDDRNDELMIMQSRIDDMKVRSDTNTARAHSLRENIVQLNHTLYDVKEELSHFNEMRTLWEKMSRKGLLRARKKPTVSKRVRRERIAHFDQVHQLKLLLMEKETEMNLFKERTKNYECVVAKLRMKVEKKQKQLEKLKKFVAPNSLRRKRKHCSKRYKNFMARRRPESSKRGTDDGNDEVFDSGVSRPSHSHSLSLPLTDNDDDANARKTGKSCPYINASDEERF